MQMRHACFAVLGTAIFTFSHAAGTDEKPTMKAVVAHEYGAPDVLKFEDAPRPEPQDDEALVRVIASGVNPADPLTLSGKYAKEFGTHLPLIPGYDIAGVVEKTGANVSKLKVADAVYGYPTFGGGWADYITVKEWEVAAKPKSLTFVEAAAVPMGALTAWQSLVDIAKLQPGQTILIQGGAGGVAGFAIQLAKHLDATVITTASARNHEYVRSLGADRAIDYNTQDFVALVHDCDVVFDTVGGEVQVRSYAVLKPGGRLVWIAAAPAGFQPTRKDVEVLRPNVKRDRAHLDRMLALYGAGAVWPPAITRYKLAAAAEAHRVSEGRHLQGKLVLMVR